MKSPFPGMDPYLETYWSDWHGRLLRAIRDQLNPQLAGRFRAVVAARATANDTPSATADDERPADDHPTKPLAVLPERWREPLIIPSPFDAPALRIQIHDTWAANRAVTVIEVLCPANKANRPQRDDWAWKQLAVRRSGANLVEIDITREGRRKLSVFPIPRSHRTTYQACVYRAFGHPRRFEVYAMPIDRPLPSIRVPLRHRTADAVLDLQPPINDVRQNPAYDDLDYARPPVPPLSRTDAAWAAELLANRPV